jgi:hypothetical protein
MLPPGPEYVDVQHLHGSAQAKQRLRVILETMMGLRDQGCTLEQCGRLLNLASRTLRQWDQDCRLSRPETITRVGVGRPTAL